MGGTKYDVDPARVTEARGDVLAIHKELSTDYQTLSTSVEALLTSGWRGKARDAYAKGWADWLDGASKVLAGLEEMGGLLGLTRESYDKNEDVTSAQIQAAATRVRTRLS